VASRRIDGRGERGVGLVEMGIVAPFLILVALGIIEFGSAYNQKISLNQAVRDGARAGTTGEFPGCTGTDYGSNVICVAERATDVDASFKVIATSGAPEVVVCATAALSSDTPIISPFLDGRTLKSKVTMRVEQDRLDDEGVTPSGATSGTGDFSGWCD
jgi:Flp pilus assembly protein TadG